MIRKKAKKYFLQVFGSKSAIHAFYIRYKSMLLYCVLGVCTTIINVSVYGSLVRFLGMSVMESTIAAWICAVLFAYFTNRTWVFCSKAVKFADIIRELGAFFMMRAATGVIDFALMWVFADCMRFQDIFVKAVSNVIVIIVNFLASKFVIFK